MKLEPLDIMALEYLHKAFKKAVFKEISGNEVFALSRGVLVLDSVIQSHKEEKKQPSQDLIPLEEVVKTIAKGKKKRG